MTNAEKYLKEGTKEELKGKLFNVLKNYCYREDKDYEMEMAINEFFNAPATPTLTEDERVILRNIPKKYSTIARNLVGGLSAKNNDDWRYLEAFNHLFQFIKERRRIRNKGVTR